MVVQVRGSRKSNTSLSSESLSPLRSPKSGNVGIGHIDSLIDNREFRDANTIPFYDRNDTLPVSNLVMHLCDLFFVHLGCSFPFLQRDRFLRDLKDKKVDTMLVDAVCALAARFSPHPLLGPPQAPSIDGSELETDVKNSDRGQAFAHRAMGALVDSLSCPTLSVVQACLLLAYEQFGSNHDSGLWMYLGIAIRMAQDLGMQKLQGLQHSYGRRGVTPSAVVSGRAGQLREEEYDQSNDAQVPLSPSAEMNHSEDHRAWEREKVDTFWSIFFLDRVISSGTGRPVTLRDEEIELCFPLQSESKLSNGWPAPFPPLIRIIHLYGRVTDLINGIQDANHVTAETLKRLAGMESDLTDQKAKGIVDPLLYTEEEMENATETFPLPPSAASTYRQAKSPLSATVEPKKAASAANSSTQGRVSPRIDPGQDLPILLSIVTATPICRRKIRARIRSQWKRRELRARHSLHPFLMAPRNTVRLSLLDELLLPMPTFYWA
ncbi:hypothetical protein ACP6JC_008884 [Aspergillus fumigatus]